MQVGSVLGYLLAAARRGFPGGTTLWPGELKISLVPLLLRGMGKERKGTE